jgi:thioredoxin reductase (NADPH)
MAQNTLPITQSRSDQMFPMLEAAEIGRLRRFGAARTYPAGTFLVRAGDEADGLHVILSGDVIIAPHEEHLRDQPIVIHSTGGFMGELAQLSGRPSLVDATASTDVEAIVITPRRLRDVMVEEAELGERIMRALILRRVALIQQGIGGPIIVGHAHNRDVLRLEGFLRRNGHPHQRLDPDTDHCAKTLLERFQPAPEDLPIVLCPNGELLRNPGENQLARCIGLLRSVDPGTLYDVAIVGAGPAGLAAAVYAASEGLSVVVLDSRAFGGQAGASARIENYLGFPTGITGMALMARAYNQAQKFGVEMAIPQEVARLEDRSAGAGGPFTLHLANDETVNAHTVVIASGAKYRRLAIDNLAEFEGSSVHYWASPLEAKLCAREDVALVGAGNSAGQGAVYLASQGSKVWLLVRGKSLNATMSRYLCDRIAAQPNIEVLVETEVSGLEGRDGSLERIRWRHRASGAETHRALRHLFLFIGAEPNTPCLAQSNVVFDDRGFVRAEPFAGDGRLPFETSHKGVFAIGDVRSGSVKRVAAAVGEGAQVVAALHAFLARAGEHQSGILGQGEGVAASAGPGLGAVHV